MLKIAPLNKRSKPPGFFVGYPDGLPCLVGGAYIFCNGMSVYGMEVS